MTVGMPSCRTPLSDLGIFLRRTELDLSFPFRSCCRSSSLCSFRYGRAASTVIPSMPDAPWFHLTCLYKWFRLSLSRMRSIKSLAPFLSLSSGEPVLGAPTYLSRSTLSVCGQPIRFLCSSYWLPFYRYLKLIMVTLFPALQVHHGYD